MSSLNVSWTSLVYSKTLLSNPFQLVAFSRVIPAWCSDLFTLSPFSMHFRSSWSCVRNPRSASTLPGLQATRVQLLIRGRWSQACQFRDQGHLWDLAGFDNAPLFLHSKSQTENSVVTWICSLFLHCKLGSFIYKKLFGEFYQSKILNHFSFRQRYVTNRALLSGPTHPSMVWNISIFIFMFGIHCVSAGFPTAASLIIIISHILATTVWFVLTERAFPLFSCPVLVKIMLTSVFLASYFKYPSIFCVFISIVLFSSVWKMNKPFHRPLYTVQFVALEPIPACTGPHT